MSYYVKIAFEEVCGLMLAGAAAAAVQRQGMAGLFFEAAARAPIC